jgi:hypothetical protein
MLTESVSTDITHELADGIAIALHARRAFKCALADD